MVVKAPMLHFLDSGLEMDVLVNLGDRLHAIEAKSAATATPDFFKGFTPFAERVANTGLPAQIENAVVYGGEASQQRSTARLIAWRDVEKILRVEKET